jgi:two-component system chemotaxis response regulator CheB
MDVEMPIMDGLVATRKIMETTPTPIIIVSTGFQPINGEKTFLALQSGAVAVVEKPSGPNDQSSAKLAFKLIQTVKSMAEVKVLKRWPVGEASNRRPREIPNLEQHSKTSDIRVIAIGASTGGPPAIQTLLSGLPKKIPVPVLIVQHITAGFIRGLSEWLTTSTGMLVHVASPGEIAMPGRAYLASDGAHLGITRQGQIICTAGSTLNGFCPSVSHLFQSVTSAFGSHAVGVLLTGMGSDGAEELLALRNSGAETFAQDMQSSVVHGMPGEAIKLGAAKHILSPEQIAITLTSMLV